MTVRIGLTGPIGCGKSTVASWLAESGAVVIDADLVARQVVEPGTPTLERVIERFGPSVRQADGALDRAALGAIVFADPAALRDLESLVHPAVRAVIASELDRAEVASTNIVVIEAIKLVEGGLADSCDETWLITCGPTVQLERLMGRGLQEADAGRRITAQGEIRSRLAPAVDRIVATDGPPELVRARVSALLDDALRAHGSGVGSGSADGTGSGDGSGGGMAPSTDG